MDLQCVLLQFSFQFHCSSEFSKNIAMSPEWHSKGINGFNYDVMIILW